jgi:hypothetical protein
VEHAEERAKRLKRNGLTLPKVESLTSMTSWCYEPQVLTGGKKSEVQVGPDGKPLDHEE